MIVAADITATVCVYPAVRSRWETIMPIRVEKVCLGFYKIPHVHSRYVWCVIVHTNRIIYLWSGRWTFRLPYTAFKRLTLRCLTFAFSLSLTTNYAKIISRVWLEWILLIVSMDIDHITSCCSAEVFTIIFQCYNWTNFLAAPLFRFGIGRACSLNSRRNQEHKLRVPTSGFNYFKTKIFCMEKF